MTPGPGPTPATMRHRALPVLGLLLALLTGCGPPPPDFKMKTGERLKYHYSYKMNYGKGDIFSNAEPKKIDGVFHLFGGEEIPVSDNPNITAKAQEIKMAFIPDNLPDSHPLKNQKMVQPTLGVQIMPLSGDLRIVWGVPVLGMEFVFFRFGGAKLKREFKTSAMVDTPWLNKGVYVTDIPVKPYRPTESEWAHLDYYKKYGGSVFRYDARKEFGPEDLIPLGRMLRRYGFQQKRSWVVIKGEIIVDRRSRRILRREENQIYRNAITGPDRQGVIHNMVIDRGETALLELME